jgi:hypothetical protein
MRIIELKEKEFLEDGIHLIAECNDYNPEGFLAKQLSRSPFVIINTEWTDEEIIASLWANEYSIYY